MATRKTKKKKKKRKRPNRRRKESEIIPGTIMRRRIDLM
jgi:hypothetical protein